MSGGKAVYDLIKVALSAGCLLMSLCKAVTARKILRCCRSFNYDDDDDRLGVRKKALLFATRSQTHFI